MQSRQSERSVHEGRTDAADTLSVASSAVSPTKIGLGRKIALVPTLYRLVRRYPVPALIVGGIALVYYFSRRRQGSEV
jgi:hypothetical protein